MRDAPVTLVPSAARRIRGQHALPGIIQPHWKVISATLVDIVAREEDVWTAEKGVDGSFEGVSQQIIDELVPGERYDLLPTDTVTKEVSTTQ